MGRAMGQGEPPHEHVLALVEFADGTIALLPLDAPPCDLPVCCRLLGEHCRAALQGAGAQPVRLGTLLMCICW